MVKQRLAGEAAAFQLYCIQRPVLGQRDTAVIKQIVVNDFIHAAVIINIINVLVQLGRVLEGLPEAFGQFAFLRGQAVGVLRVNGREVPVKQLIFLSVQGNGIIVIVDFVQQETALHFIFRMTFQQLALQLKQDDCNSLVHPCGLLRIDRVQDIFIQYMRLEPLAGVVAVDLRCKHGQWTQVNAIAVLNDIEGVIARCNPQYVHDADPIACHCTHPVDIVIAPLDIYVMVPHELVEDFVGTRAAVKQVADDMQFVHGQLLDQMAQCNNQRFRNFGSQDGVNDLAEIAALITVGVIGQQQFIENESIVRVHCFMNSGAGVFA